MRLRHELLGVLASLPGRFTCEVLRRGPRLELRCHGELDLGSRDHLVRVLAGSLSDEHSHVSVDLSGVRFLDCAGLRALTRLRAIGAEQGVHVTLDRPSREVRRLFELAMAPPHDPVEVATASGR